MGLAGAEKGPLTGATEGGAAVAESVSDGCAPVGDVLSQRRAAVRMGFRHVRTAGARQSSQIYELYVRCAIQLADAKQSKSRIWLSRATRSGDRRGR